MSTAPNGGRPDAFDEPSDVFGGVPAADGASDEEPEDEYDDAVDDDGGVVLPFRGAGESGGNGAGVVAVDGGSGGYGLAASAPTGRRVRARLSRFNAPWQT